MIGDWDDYGKADSERYFDFSEAYLKAAIDVCGRMVSDREENIWANASTSMMNAAHAVELFLNGALLAKGEEARGHSIDALFGRYLAVFPEEEHSFKCPFVTEYLGRSPREFKLTGRCNKDVPSIRLRYPLNRPGVEWEGAHGFEPKSFSTEMRRLLTFVKRSRSLHVSP